MFTLPETRVGLSSSFQSGGYRSPYDSYAANSTPNNWYSVLEWCQNVFINNGTYREAINRLVSYFITEIDIGAASADDSVGDQESDKWSKLFNAQLDVPGYTRLSNMDAKCYGNYFITVHVPFQRFLQCPRCGSQWLLRDIATNSKFHFQFVSYEFHAKCPGESCKHSGKFNVVDHPLKSPDSLKLKLWPPQEIEILHDLYTNDVSYLWRIPEDYKANVRQGKLFAIERVSMEVLEAIKANQLFMFNDDVIFHGKEPAPTGLRTRGWGFSPLLFNSRAIWYVELLQRYNEAIALDYVIPVRILSPTGPSGSSGVGDTLRSDSASNFVASARRMLETHRRNPTSWGIMPYPVQYQQLSGDASKLAPKDLLDQGYDLMLNAAGVPPQLYRFTLDGQLAPLQMRLLEATNHPMVQRNNDLLAWLVKRICHILSWEPVVAKYRRVQHADDTQRQMAILQLATGGRVSETDALKMLGLNRRDQRRQLLEEARFDQEQQAQMQEEMDQAAFGQQIAKGTPDGQAPQGGGQPQQGGGDPAAQGGQGMLPAGAGAGNVAAMIPGANNPMTPEDMESAAFNVAQQLLGEPASQRITDLRSIADKNPSFHKLVKGHMEKLRSQAASQGKQMVLQQQFGGASG